MLRAIGGFSILIAIAFCAACGSTAETSVTGPSPSPARCGVQVQAERSFTSDGGTGTVQVTTNRECQWTAQSGAPWVNLTPPTNGQGDGTIKFTVAPNGDPSTRAAMITVEDQQLQISQTGKPCSFRLSSTFETVDAAGGERTVQVSTTSTQCHWTATASVPWITVVSGSEGSDNGVVRFQIAPLSGPARSGTLTVAGQEVTVQQGAGCTYTIGTDALSFGASGGSGSVPVSSPVGCAWTASSASDWITLTAGQAGNGPGAVRLTIASNSGPPRSGRVSVAGQTVTVNQTSGCAVTVTPTSVNVGAAASAGALQVATAQGCSWSATSPTPWISLAGGSSGSGNGQVTLSVAANTGPVRQGLVSVGDQMVSVTQASGCTYSVTPLAVDVAGGTSPGAVSVATAPGCAWNASSGVEWITVGAASGAGSGQLPFTVATNPGIARTGRFTVADQIVTVNQASLCTWTVLPPSSTFGSSGGVGSLLVIVTGACTWNASSDVSWISLLSGASGSGNGLVQFTVAPNGGPPRTGSLTIAGQRYEVTQSDR